MWDGQKRRTGKNLDLSILNTYKNPGRTFASGGPLFIKSGAKIFD